MLAARAACEAASDCDDLPCTSMGGGRSPRRRSQERGSFGEFTGVVNGERAGFEFATLCGSGSVDSMPPYQEHRWLREGSVWVSNEDIRGT